VAVTAGTWPSGGGIVDRIAERDVFAGVAYPPEFA
jgi:hypothetical protein